MRKKKQNANVPDSLTGGTAVVKYQTDDNKDAGFHGNGTKKWAAIIIGILLLAVLTGCGNSTPPAKFVIKAGPVLVSSREFAQELDVKLTAYPYDINKRPVAYNTMVMDLVATLSEETVLLAAAQAKGIEISSEAVILAEEAFKKDYPGDSFDQILVENAISYTAWKNRFKKDMVIEKLVQQDLVAVQEITPEDMVGFYNDLDRGDDPEKNQAIDEAGLVELLRREKSQTAYERWINDLKSAYPLEIDEKAVAAFLKKME